MFGLVHLQAIYENISSKYQTVPRQHLQAVLGQFDILKKYIQNWSVPQFDCMTLQSLHEIWRNDLSLTESLATGDFVNGSTLHYTRRNDQSSQRFDTWLSCLWIFTSTKCPITESSYCSVSSRQTVFDRETGFFAVLLNISYSSLGCWRDTPIRAIPPLEGKDPILNGKHYRSRIYAIQKCAQAAHQRNFTVFALQVNLLFFTYNFGCWSRLCFVI